MIAKPNLTLFELFKVNPVLITKPNCFCSYVLSVRSVNTGLPNLWVYLTEVLGEFYSVISVEELPSRNCLELIR